MTHDPRLSVCLTFSFDAMSGWIAETDNPGAISRGEFGAVAVPRILALLAKHDIKGTFFIPGHTALAYPHLVREIRDAGHEIGHHGWVHENPANFDLDGERRNFERALEALEEVAGVRPVGYRSPSGDFSVNSINVLLEYGMRYESTFGGSDFFPYYLRKGDRWSKTEPYEFGEPCELVELPFSWILDDWPHFEFHVGWSTEQSAPSTVREIWQGEFDYAHANCAGGVYVLCTHPEVSGRGHRLTMLDAFIAYMQEHDGVVFETCGSPGSASRASGRSGGRSPPPTRSSRCSRSAESGPATSSAGAQARWPCAGPRPDARRGAQLPAREGFRELPKLQAALGATPASTGRR